MSSNRTDPAMVFNADNFTTLLRMVDPSTFFNARCVSKSWYQKICLQKYMADRYGFPLWLFNIVDQPIEVMKCFERLRAKNAQGLKTLYLNA